MKFVSVALAASILFAPLAQAANTELQIANKANGRPGIDLSIDYTVGTHVGYASSVTGRALVDFESASVSSAEFRVSIASMTTGNTKRDCHMREALGLDYALSGYPENHICDANNNLPASGVDSVQYPEVIFELRGLNAADGTPLTRIDAGAEVPVLALGSWTIHGVRKDQVVSLKATRTQDENGRNRLRVRGDFNLLLKDFGIEVMSWAGLIKVADRAKVKLDLDLNETR